MKKLFKLCLLLFSLFLIGCQQGANTNQKNEAIEKPNMLYFVLVNQCEIIGTDFHGSFPSPTPKEKWKGCFTVGRKVALSSYEIAKYETTYALWKEVYDWAIENGYTFANKGLKGSRVGTIGSDLEPVTRVSWRDVIVWCNACTEKSEGSTSNCVYYSQDKELLKDATAKVGDNFICDTAFFDRSKTGFRLPTEAEWEYAARLKKDGSLTPLNYLSGAKKICGYDTLNPLPEGETWESLRDEATRLAVFMRWFSDGRTKFLDKKWTQEVGSKDPNDIGAYDMSGNVWEWCWDFWHDVPGTDDVLIDGVATNPTGPKTGYRRVIRGGGWNGYNQCCMVGLRQSGTAKHNEDNLTTINRHDHQDNTIGFRLARGATIE